MLSNGKSAALGLQHVLAMYAGAVIVPLLIGGALNFTPEEMTYLVSIDIFMCGVATLLQLTVNKFFGIGLPVVLGCAIQAVSPLILIGSNQGIGAMYGSIIVAGIFIILISGVFSKIKRFFPPVVTGTVITVIGLTLIPVALEKMGGGSKIMTDFGSTKFLVLAFVTIATILIVQIYGIGFMRSIAVLIGLLVGTGLAAFLGMVNLAPVAEATWFHMPQPFYFGRPTFEWSSILTMILISLVSMVESTGVYFALGEITDKKIQEDDLKRGYRAEGLAVLLGGIFNTFPYTGFSQNVGLVQLSGIKNRKPIYFSAGFLILLGLLPKIGAVATIIPDPVLGGAMLVMFGMVATQGIRMLAHVDFTNESNLLVVAMSVGLGLGVTVVPELFAGLPETVQLFTSNGIVVASLTSIILNVLFNKKERGKVDLETSTVGSEFAETGNSH
ncbi:nucleobase:cation symporter-2 family protein [Carnobacterium maltaromaticum]|jgi:xanthine permease|uniref:Xanthine permease family protein n=1 Tax=Carnobacterium maltaromaticum LMA28 TaxID=1234679 RepID=K8E2L0_CARML|nr:nucleobase:cation symporter-2 family protein [Carnobacterium maltaromaticum]AOA01291.1 Uric acid permease PucJ [Carnobacterium maltaromaticum]KRN62921.1 Xanthine uracil permease [Carnobacterium maltaromaticum DSM 20342]MCI1819882.1 purine permease [Carnobacterium maltaromaticum]MDW5523401.1 nucleobase:cation symporter-2 family protein [Carnobacterium maltaromaticum]CCO10312.2 xanthine permease family protein [Carnobacterium maltaromaticum LMA28]